MRVVLERVTPWRHDLAGCLHACAGTLLAQGGHSPLDALGSGWHFQYREGGFRREEYYLPLAQDQSLFGALAPYHPVDSAWHLPLDADDGWRQVREAVLGGTPVAVAVDNYYLPFRPAHQDVHANHLIIVYGFDDERGTARVMDTVPPRFDGDISQSVLRAARGSGNRGEHERDMFFADQDISHRWLEPRLGEPVPVPDRSAVTASLRANHRGFTTGDTGPYYSGLPGMAAFLTDVETRYSAAEPVADELFIVAGAALATTALHAEWLRTTGVRLSAPALTELGRDVERLAHHWTAVRIMSALTRGHEVPPDRLARRHRDLLLDHGRVLSAMSDLLEER
ncbi:BtrH N-terminal domain-containing protein [Streptomyces sp. NPDC006638]|uniref:BtrH N-terminal domain-containing protein n=1 Tax=unclassified Streptomyces TaxID=2593676 RepID=UPI0033B9129E